MWRRCFWNWILISQGKEGGREEREGGRGEGE